MTTVQIIDLRPFTRLGAECFTHVASCLLDDLHVKGKQPPDAFLISQRQLEKIAEEYPMDEVPKKKERSLYGYPLWVA